MKILHINLERGWRGGERQTLYLMEGLRSRGHECSLLARRGDVMAQRARDRGFLVIEIGKPFLLRGYLLRHYDVIHAHEMRGLQIASLWKGFHARPVVYTRRVDYTPSGDVITRMTYARVDTLVAISRKIESIMREWGFDADRIRVIRSTVHLGDGEPFPGKVAALRERFHGKKVAGCVAALVGHKDHRTLLEAASLLKDARPDIVFVLVGDGPLAKQLKQYARELGLSNVLFEGYQPDPYPYFKIFDVFVLTSKEEGLGSSILDAFRYKVPVVATAAGGVPELVVEGQTGLLVETGDPRAVADAILRILEDPVLRASCVERAHCLVTSVYTVENMAGSYEQVYRDVLSSL